MTSEDWMMMSTMSYISDYDLALFPCKPLPNFLSECWARVWKQPMQTSAQLPGRGFGNKANYCCWEFLAYIDAN